MASTLRADELNWFAIEPGNRFYRATAAWGLDALLELLDQLPDHPEPTGGYLQTLLTPAKAAAGADRDDEPNPPLLSSLVTGVRRHGSPAALDALAELVRALLCVPQPLRGDVFDVLRRGLATVPKHTRLTPTGLRVPT